jgi:hypothetical protein
MLVGDCLHEAACVTNRGKRFRHEDIEPKPNLTPLGRMPNSPIREHPFIPVPNKPESTGIPQMYPELHE